MLIVSYAYINFGCVRHNVILLPEGGIAFRPLDQEPKSLWGGAESTTSFAYFVIQGEILN